MENFALITLVEELRAATTGMIVRRIVELPGRVFFFETRTGRMPGLRLSLAARHPSVWIPGRPVSSRTKADDFVMVLRKHLLDARLLSLRKSLSERIVEIQFRTALPARELQQVVLVLELFPNSPNLLLLDQSRRVLATASPLAPQRGISRYDEYSYPETHKIPLETVLGEDTSWFDEDAFASDPAGWLLRGLAGVGPVLAAELARRAPAWSRAPEGIPGGIRALVGQLREPARTAWVYTTRPLGDVLGNGDAEALRTAVVSPIELASMREQRSCQTFPGMVTAVGAVADALESANLLEDARSRELRRLRRECRSIGLQREKLLERQRRFEEASALQATARLLAASGAEMDRHHASVSVTEYTEEGSEARSVSLDPTRTLRENVARMFKAQQKAGRGLEMVQRELSRLAGRERAIEERERRVRALTHWDDWPAAAPTRGDRKERPEKAPARRRRFRSVTLDGHDVFIGRNSRENDEVTFRIAAGNDFWLHVADYSGSHVIVSNPSGADELGKDVLVRAAELAAWHSQARNSAKVEVHYTQRKFVSKPRKARPGLVRLRQYQTITVEPRDWTREEQETR
jgi:predicted ribosome quality control (RQC) complex YloA/Tae2 family protein